MRHQPKQCQDAGTLGDRDLDGKTGLPNNPIYGEGHRHSFVTCVSVHIY